jgi:hypothetical protein
MTATYHPTPSWLTRGATFTHMGLSYELESWHHTWDQRLVLVTKNGPHVIYDPSRTRPRTR